MELYEAEALDTSQGLSPDHRYAPGGKECGQETETVVDFDIWIDCSLDGQLDGVRLKDKSGTVMIGTELS